MCILKHGTTDILFANDGSNAGECDIQHCRLGKLWGKEPELYLAGAARLSLQCNGKDGCRWRMSFEIEMQELNPKMFVSCWQRRLNNAGMRSSAVKRQRDRYGRQSHNACLRP